MKVLIISHNPITTYHNMGKTMLALFQSFSMDELCQLYIYPTIPDIDFCSSYFRITDKDILNSYLSLFKVNSGTIDKNLINSSNLEYENPQDVSKYRVSQDYKRLLRDLLWKFAHWYNKSLKEWIESERPTCIFVAPGDALFLYDIAIKISDDYDLPIVTYICDDFYFIKKPQGLVPNIRYKGLIKKTKKLLNKTSQLITICNELVDPYEREFGVPANVIMTGAKNFSENVKPVDFPDTITYMGNIRCNRSSTLAEVGRVIDEINNERNTSFRLDIYTGEQNPEILRDFEGVKSIKLCGFVTGSEYEKVFNSSQIFLHTEAFDEMSIDTVKHSVSTKIAEVLASGIPMIAYGPNCVSSMKHLIRNKSAFIVTSPSELKDTLLSAFFDNEKRVEIAKSGLKTAEKYHNLKHNSKSVRKIFNYLYK